MINPFKDINWSPERTELRKFAWSLIIGFPCLALVFFLAKWIKTHEVPALDFFLKLGGIGAAIGIVCLAVPLIARPLYYIWYGIAGVMGLIMGNLIFCVMFYLLFTPIGLVMKLMGRDALNLKWQRTSASHWIDAPPAPSADHYFSQF
jgi:hypothetical protein